jgi:putative redox protein
VGIQRLEWTGADLEFLGHTTWGDPVAIGEQGGPGAKPSDLLPLSLAACTAYDVVVILRKQRQDLRGLEVVTTTEQELEAPWTFTKIHQHFVITGEVDDGKAARAIDLAESKYCAVAATLRDRVALSHTHEIRPAGG